MPTSSISMSWSRTGGRDTGMGCDVVGGDFGPWLEHFAGHLAGEYATGANLVGDVGEGEAAKFSVLAAAASLLYILSLVAEVAFRCRSAELPCFRNAADNSAARTGPLFTPAPRAAAAAEPPLDEHSVWLRRRCSSATLSLGAVASPLGIRDTGMAIGRVVAGAAVLGWEAVVVVLASNMFCVTVRSWWSCLGLASRDGVAVVGFISMCLTCLTSPPGSVAIICTCPAWAARSLLSPTDRVTHGG